MVSVRFCSPRWIDDISVGFSGRLLDQLDELLAAGDGHLGERRSRVAGLQADRLRGAVRSTSRTTG